MDDNQSLTRRESQVFAFIKRQMTKTSVMPSHQQMQKGLRYKGINTVVRAVKGLCEKGWLIKGKRHHARSLRFGPNAPPDPKGMPLRGTVSAGYLLEAIEDDDRVEFTMFADDKKCFCLAVSGDSMANAHIVNGDYLIIDPTKEPREGEIVVVRTSDNEATVKYFHREKDRIRLEPANDHYETIFVDLDATIVGVATSIVRPSLLANRDEDRQKRIVELRLCGLTFSQIAERVGLSERAVKDTVAQVRKRVEAREAVR